MQSYSCSAFRIQVLFLPYNGISYNHIIPHNIVRTSKVGGGVIFLISNIWYPFQEVISVLDSTMFLQQAFYNICSEEKQTPSILVVGTFYHYLREAVITVKKTSNPNKQKNSNKHIQINKHVPPCLRCLRNSSYSFQAIFQMHSPNCFRSNLWTVDIATTSNGTSKIQEYSP